MVQDWKKLVRFVVIALGVASVVPPGTASDKRAMTIADYYKTAFVNGGSVSSDGDRVAFAVRRYEIEKGETWSEIWTMRADGSDLRQMTQDRKDNGSPIFSPDGRTLLFVSDREEGRQLWAMPVDGGESRRLTSFHGGVSAPVYSPDGQWIAAAVKVYPECGADSDCNKKIGESWANGPLQAHMADELLYRHWTSWADGKRSHILLFDARTGEPIRDLTPGNWESPTFSLAGGRGFTFSPDSKELCFVSNRDSDQATSTNADLWVVPVDGSSEARNLTDDNDGWDGRPRYSPSGRFIAFSSQATPGFEADLFRLAIHDRQTGSNRYLTDRSSFDNWIDEFAWLPDSGALVFQAQVEGRSPLYEIDLDSGSIEPRLEGHSIDHWELTPDGRAVIFSRRSIGEPAEMYRAELGGGVEQLTGFNADLQAEVDIRPAEEMWVDGDGDYKVQVFVVKPHGFDPGKKYPLILNVHGGPQSQWSDSFRGDWQIYPAKGYVVAFANPTGSTGRGQEFVDAISCDWGGRVYRDLMKVTDALAAQPWVDEERMGAMGWSYGGYMMMWFQGHTDRFKAQAAMMGVYDLRSMHGATEELWFPEKDLCGTPWDSEEYERWSPSVHAAKFSTPTLVITGELDYRVPYTQSLQYFTALQRQGVPSRLIVYPGAGHWPGWYEMAFYYLAHVDWFHEYLGGGEPDWEVDAFLRNQVFDREESGSP